MIQIRCNACGTTHHIDASLAGTVVTCSSCASPMTVPAMAKPVVPGPPRASPAGGAAAPMARPVVPTAHAVGPPAQMAAPLPPHLVPGAAQSAPPPMPPSAGQSASGLDGFADHVEPYHVEGQTPGIFRMLLVAVLWIVMLAAVVGGGYAAYQHLLDPSDSSNAARQHEDDDDPPAAAKEPWTDVSKGNVAQQLGGIKVRVTGVEFAEVLAKDANNRVQSSEGSLFLQVFIRVENTTKRDVDYRSWYGNLFNTGGRKSVATLVDNEDRKYSMMTFGDVVTIKGHVPSATLKTRNIGGEKKFAEDVLVFDVPAGIVPQQVEYFRLELPAAAVNARGQFRFQFPGSMINQSSRAGELSAGFE